MKSARQSSRISMQRPSKHTLFPVRWRLSRVSVTDSMPTSTCRL